MKNIFTIIGVVLMLSFVFAAGGQEILSATDAMIGGPDSDMAQGDGLGVGNGSQVANAGEGQKIQLQSGEHIGMDGEQMMIRTEANNQMRLEVGGKTATSSMVMSQEMVNGQTKLTAKLSNGRDAEVKVMPDAASEVAIQRLRLKTCSEEAGCSIELKEVGAGEKAQLAYEVKTQRRAKVLGLFGAEMKVQAQVNAETGELLGVSKPWWAVLASEPAE